MIKLTKSDGGGRHFQAKEALGGATLKTLPLSEPDRGSVFLRLVDTGDMSTRWRRQLLRPVNREKSFLRRSNGGPFFFLVHRTNWIIDTSRRAFCLFFFLSIKQIKTIHQVPTGTCFLFSLLRGHYSFNLFLLGQKLPVKLF